MGRIHLFEFEDLSWFPQFLRNYETDFLRFLSNKTGLFKPTIPLINKGLKEGLTNQVIDLGSGGGGPILSLYPVLRKKHPELKILLTDKFPNIDAYKMVQQRIPSVKYLTEPVDARNLPKKLTGLRTLFLLLHHFRQDGAKKILQNAVDTGQPIAIFEAQERSLTSIIAMLLSPLSVWLSTPFIGPFKPGRILFTYLIPVVPLVVLWDGIVSSLRTYSILEMNELLNSLNNADTFNWEVGRKRSGPGWIIYLLGIPK